MRRTLATVMLLAAFAAGNALADDASHRSIALGYHDALAPVGLRWWLGGQKIGIDLGVGAQGREVPNSPAGVETNESITDFAIDVGVPFVAHSWDRVHFLVRPGFQYVSNAAAVVVDVSPGVADVTKDRGSSVSGLLELEGEVFLADNFSVSAAQGFRFTSTTPPDFGGSSESSTTFGTVGGNFTQVGFHIYLFGPTTDQANAH